MSLAMQPGSIVRNIHVLAESHIAQWFFLGVSCAMCVRARVSVCVCVCVWPTSGGARVAAGRDKGV